MRKRRQHRNKQVISLLVLLLAGCGTTPTPESIAVKGEKGATGTAGAVGSSGMTIQSTLSCSKIDAGVGYSLLYQYQSVVYSTGDRYVNCDVTTPAGNFSYEQLYKASQNGALTGNCNVTADVDSPSYGYWHFTSQNNITQAIYSDANSTNNNYTFTFADANCITL